MKAYQSLEAHFENIANLNHVKEIAYWDEASMMPSGGGTARGEAMASLELVLHKLYTEEHLEGLMVLAGTEALDDWQAANLREIRRIYYEKTCLPEGLVVAQKLATTKSEQAWRVRRGENNWQAMAPLLSEVVNLARQEAQVRAEATGLSKYDSLLDTYEPGVRACQLDTTFAKLKQTLPELLQNIIQHQKRNPSLPINGEFPIEQQKQVGLEIMTAMGFNFDHGRLDVSHHPFCGGVPQDVRITTRYQTDSFIPALMGVVHETGHALYEQGLPKSWLHQPVGVALSSGTHESQSLLMEMQACRTKAFLEFVAPKLRQAFAGNEAGEQWSTENLHKHYTQVGASYIRVDADEVSYPLHIILRYEIERDLIEGKLEVADIPDVWHEKMQRYLGLSTEGNYTDGCLQDVHWPAGLFGYFPTYTLGAMAAAQLFSAATNSLAGDGIDVHAEISHGRFEHLLAWLRKHVHQNGKLLGFDDLMRGATGNTLDANYFLNHLSQRYLP